MEYSAGLLQLTDATGTANVTTTINLQSIDMPQNQEVTSEDSGSVYDEALSLTNLMPVYTGTCGAILEMLRLTNINTGSEAGDGWECIDANKNLVLAKVIFRRLDKCTTDLGSTPHLSAALDFGLLRLTSLTADRAVDAVLNWTLDAFSDDPEVSPVIMKSDEAWPSTIVQQRFELGACKLGGIEMPDLDGVTVDWNIEITDKQHDWGSVYASPAGIVQIKPTITFRGQDLSQVWHDLHGTASQPADTFIMTGQPATHTDTVIQLIQRKNEGAFESFTDNTKHISLTASGMVTPSNIGSGTGRARATNELIMNCRLDSSAAIKRPIDYKVTAYDPFPIGA